MALVAGVSFASFRHEWVLCFIMCLSSSISTFLWFFLCAHGVVGCVASLEYWARINFTWLHCTMFFPYYWILFANTVTSRYFWILYLQFCLPTSNCFCDPLSGHLWARAEQQSHERVDPPVLSRGSTRRHCLLVSACAVNKCPFHAQLQAICLDSCALGSLSLCFPREPWFGVGWLGAGRDSTEKEGESIWGFLWLCSRCWAAAGWVGKSPSPFTSWKGFLVFLL